MDDADCGLACVLMVLNYSGKLPDYFSVKQPSPMAKVGFSLLHLRELAGELGLESNCVRLDLDWMRNNKSPVILHMINPAGQGHFQVCFGSRKTKNGIVYLMADPATQVYEIPEKELITLWPKGAALYFKGLAEIYNKSLAAPWSDLFVPGLLPKAFWLMVPLFNITIGGLGLAVSWVLQRGMESSLAEQKSSLIISVIFLLSMIILFKNLLNYLKNQALIKLNRSVNERLVYPFVGRLLSGSFTGIINTRIIRQCMADIQKIQNGLTIFVDVLLSDCSLIALLLSVTLYTAPMSVLINLAYLFIMSYLAFLFLPRLSHAQARLNELSGIAERQLLEEIVSGKRQTIQEFQPRHLMLVEKNGNFQSEVKKLAIKISRINFAYESIGSINVITVFVYGIDRLINLTMSYSSFMILVIAAYIISALTPRLIGALNVVAEGAAAARQYSVILGKN